MILQLKATALTLSSEDGEETTYSGACLAVGQYLTAFAQSLFFTHTLVHKQYTMEAVAIPHRRKHQCVRSLSAGFRSEIIPTLRGPVKLLQSLSAYSRQIDCDLLTVSEPNRVH